MVPWAIWTVLVAAINLTLFIAIRGRWSRQAVVLAVAALVGTAVGNALAGLIDFDLLVFGEFHLAAAVIGAQMALVATAALATLLSTPDGQSRRRDGGGPGR